MTHQTKRIATNCDEAFEGWWKDKESRIMQSLCTGNAALLFSTEDGRELVKSLISLGFSAGAVHGLDEADEIIGLLSDKLKFIRAQTHLDEWPSPGELTPHRFCCALCEGILATSPITTPHNRRALFVYYYCENSACANYGNKAFMAVFELPLSIASGSPMTQEQAQEGCEAINGGSGQAADADEP